MPIEAVNFSLWVHAGSAVEINSINGMAHFLEHMIFKGTDQLQSGEFERLIEQRGGVTNAATSQDYTFYYTTVAPSDFTKAAPLQMEIVLNASIPDAAFEQERSVILEEIRRAEDSPQRLVFRRAMEVAFEQLPYYRPVLGAASVIEQLTPQQMREFHQNWYRPQSMTAVVVGNLPVEEMIQTIADRFATVQNHQACERPIWQPESPFREVVRREWVDERLQQARLVMIWRVPGLNQLDQTYALDLLAKILGQGRTARLVKDLREDKGWVSNISVSNMTQALQGVFYISAQLPVENVSAVESAIAQHIQTLQAELVTTAELAKVQTQSVTQFNFSNETPANRASLYGYYQTLTADLTPALNYSDQIQTVTLLQLQAVAQQYLSADAYGVVVLKPSR
jgi:predicted Zn-dependent peptidase